MELKILEKRYITDLQISVNYLLKYGWKVVNVFSRGDYVCAALIQE